MRCSKCSTDNAIGARFCNQCATPLSRTCPKCAHPNAPDARFCSNCAAALTSDAAAVRRSASSSMLGSEGLAVEAAEGERKTVTALFADIKGSTELEQDLDPEEARAIVDPALKLMIDAVHRYGGYVVQSTGDGVFAMFGAPVAHEDHAQRTLYAAIRMQEELRRYGARLQARGRAPVEIRVGVNTGEVVVRSIATGALQVEYTPIGHTTNVASRLQSIARTGSIVVSDATRRMCEGYFVLKSLGAARVKGVSEPVNVFEVTGLGALRTRLQRSAGRGYTQFVGRRAEMEAMKVAAEKARAGRGQIVAAMAEAGVGKSRLFYEFKVISQSGWLVLEAFSVSHGKASAFFPVIDLLNSYFEISPEDDARKRREKINGKVITLDRSLEDAIPYLFALLGIAEGADAASHFWEEKFDRLDEYLRQVQKKDPLVQMDARVRKRRTLEAIKRVLIRESLNQPLILMFEDLHWIDDETQALLDLMADSIGTSRVLILVNYRPEYTHGWTNKTYYTQLRLDPLGNESADEMMTALLGADEQLAPLKKLIAEKTEGNPFFMEEIVQGLIEDGALSRNGTTTLTRPLDALKIPATVQAVLASRIDRLPAGEKDLLQTLAVIGKEFGTSLVCAATTKSEDEIAPALSNLQLAEFIYEKPAVGEMEYTFKHALTQEVAYNSVLQQRRKLLHAKIAAAAEDLYRDQIDEHLAELAHHYARSSDVAKAIDYLARAADQASQRFLYSEAISLLNRGLELLKALPESADDARARDELRLLHAVGTALMAARGFSSDEVERAYSRACELARRQNDLFNLSGALHGLFAFYFTRGDVSETRQVAEEAMAVALRVDDDGLLKEAYRALGSSFGQAGELENAREHLEKALALKNAPSRLGPDSTVLCLTSLSDVLFGLGFPDQSLRRSYEALSLVTPESDPFSYAMALLFVIQAHCARGEAVKSEALSRDLMKLCSDRGFPYMLDAARRCLSWAIALQERYEEAIAIINQLLREKSGTEAEINMYNVLPTLAEAYGCLKDFDLAFAALQQWTEVRQKHSIASMDKSFYRIRGELRWRAGAVEDAIKDLRDAIALSAKEGSRIEQLRSTTVLARILSTQARREEARAMLAEIYGEFTEGFDIADLKEGKALIDELSA